MEHLVEFMDDSHPSPTCLHERHSMEETSVKQDGWHVSQTLSMGNVPTESGNAWVE